MKTILHYFQQRLVVVARHGRASAWWNEKRWIMTATKNRHRTMVFWQRRPATILNDYYYYYYPPPPPLGARTTQQPLRWSMIRSLASDIHKPQTLLDDEQSEILEPSSTFSPKKFTTLDDVDDDDDDDDTMQKNATQVVDVSPADDGVSNDEEDVEDDDFGFLANWIEGSDDNNNDDHQQQQSLVLFTDYPTAYGRLIDLARLTADLAYEQRGAMVGALAEAGGQDDAAEQWLRGFIALLEESSKLQLHHDSDKENNHGASSSLVLPSWWFPPRSSSSSSSSDDDDDDDDDDDANHHPNHKANLLALANNRRDDYFIKRCPDHELLKQKWGYDDYSFAQMMADDILKAIQQNGSDHFLQDGGIHKCTTTNNNNDEDVVPSMIPIHPQAVEKAKVIWGEETVTELTRPSAEEMEMDQQMQQAKQAGLVSDMGEGDWWGPASDDNPHEAYRRLIDGARHGSLMVMEKRGEYIGAVADAVQGAQMHLHKNDHDDNDDDMMDEEKKDNDLDAKSQVGDRDSNTVDAQGSGSDDGRGDGNKEDSQDGKNSKTGHNKFDNTDEEDWDK
eukprot:scaffold8708_cov112-Amphora_coffeaeformis.AAC.1